MDGRWHRSKTVDKSHKTNGSYIFDGNRGSVINWATMDVCANWSRDEREKKVVFQKTPSERKRDSDTHLSAIKTASRIIGGSSIFQHQYLTNKGLFDSWFVWKGKLIVPVNSLYTGDLMGVQMISADGDKKFLRGSRTRLGVCELKNTSAWDKTCLVEGFATGLSVRSALAEIGSRCRVLVCFSAGNMKAVAKKVSGDRFIFADNDASGVGQKVAIESGLPFLMSIRTGEDANDLHRRIGSIGLAKMLRSFVI